VYQVQDLLRRLTRDEPDMRKKLAQARMLLGALPPTRWWSPGMGDVRQVGSMGDAEIYDFFLHSQDRAYSVPQLYEWVEKGSGLHLQLSRMKQGRAAYQPQRYLKDPVLLRAAQELAPSEQAALAELLSGDMDRHTFFATAASDAAATLTNLDNVPFFYL